MDERDMDAIIVYLFELFESVPIVALHICRFIIISSFYLFSVTSVYFALVSYHYLIKMNSAFSFYFGWIFYALLNSCGPRYSENHKAD